MSDRETIKNALKIMHQLSREVYANHEKELAFKLKEKGYIHGHRITAILREMEDTGVPDVFANQFMQDRLYEMREALG